jgi:hypothetical protein
MWLVTTFGFFSIVSKPGDAARAVLTVRARSAADLERLRAHYLPELGPMERHTGTDYAFRARAPKEAVSRALAAALNDVDYSNFKGRVAERDPGRAAIYGRVWDVLGRIPEEDDGR